MEKTQLMKFIVILIIVILIVLTVASFYFYNVAVKRSPKDFLDDNPDLAVSSDQTLMNEGKAWLKTVTFEEIEMISNDGLKLKGHYLPAETESKRKFLGTCN